MRYGWIADEKFKVFTITADKENNRYKAIWLDVKVGKDAFFEKEKRDIMNFVCKRPDDFVFSCFVDSDPKLGKFHLQWHYLQPDLGWKKVHSVFYSNDEGFNNLSPSERGEIGEALGKIFTKRLLNDERATLFPEFITESLLIESGFPLNYSAYSNNSASTMERWEPDAVFQVFTNSDDVELKYEFHPKKNVFVEVKTGKNAKFERWQKEDIIQYDKLPNSFVFFCEILPDVSTSIFRINFKKLNNDEWRTFKTYHYYDFPSCSR
jgi:hypothetical protein